MKKMGAFMAKKETPSDNRCHWMAIAYGKNHRYEWDMYGETGLSNQCRSMLYKLLKSVVISD